MPATNAGDKVVTGIRDRAADAAPSHLLTTGIRVSLRDALPGLLGGTEVLVADRGTQPEVGATVVEVTAAGLIDRSDLLEEHFGPFAVVARYGDPAELEAVLDLLDPFLVGTVHAAEQDLEQAARLLPRIVDKAGRIVWNGFPTGVQVSWAMTHGGPYPATTSPLHTSVGAGAIARWVRPVSFQDVPECLLPPELTDPSLPRRVDGVLTVPALPAGEAS